MRHKQKDDDHVYKLVGTERCIRNLLTHIGDTDYAHDIIMEWAISQVNDYDQIPIHEDDYNDAVEYEMALFWELPIEDQMYIILTEDY